MNDATDGAGLISSPFDHQAFADYLRRVDRFRKRARRELRHTAFHEAGHAVYALHRAIPFEWVAVQPLTAEWSHIEEEMGPFDFGRVHAPGQLTEFDLHHVWHEQLVYTFAGPMAEARFTGAARPRIMGHDRKQADALLQASSQDDGHHLERDFRDLAQLFVDRHWAEIEAVALALIERRYLDAREIRRIAKRARSGGSAQVLKGV